MDEYLWKTLWTNTCGRIPVDKSVDKHTNMKDVQESISLLRFANSGVAAQLIRKLIVLDVFRRADTQKGLPREEGWGPGERYRRSEGRQIT